MASANVAPVTNSHPTLPLELVENIINFLSSDPRTLRATSLVSRAWVPVCRSRLFRRIVLHWCHDGLRRSDSLYSLLTRSPDIAMYVRKLSVHEGLISPERFQTTFCFAQSSSLPKLLHLLPKLRLLEFRASTLTHWCELSGELVNALLHAITSGCPLLDEVVFGSWNFASQPTALEALLNAVSRRVKTLVLTDIVTVVVPEDQHSAATRLTVTQHRLEPQRQMPLKFLTFNDGASSVLPFCSRWFNKRPAAIRSVQLSCSTNQTNISTFLGVLGAQLEQLVLDIRTLHGTWPVDLSCNTGLQSLQLQASDHLPISSRSGMSVSWLVETLSTLRSFESLEVLYISFGIEADRLSRLSQSDASAWCHLDQLLSPKRYHRLRTVKIGIRFQCHDSELEYLKEARAWMPNLHRSGCLEIHNDTLQFCCMDCC